MIPAQYELVFDEEAIARLESMTDAQLNQILLNCETLIDTVCDILAQRDGVHKGH